MKLLRMACIAAVVVLPTFKSGGASLPAQVDGHRSGLAARVIRADGTSRTVRLEGVGCTESMCSRVFIKSKVASGPPLQTWLDSVASIQDATASDALFVMRDGTEQRLAFVPDFRVLYVSNPNGGTEKLDLATIRSLELRDAGK